MNLARLPIFVTLCLSTALHLAACQNKENENARLSNSVGVTSPAGQKLTASTWCSETQVDGKGQVSFFRYTFNQKGTFLRTSMSLQDDGSVSQVAQEKGSWAVIGTQLFFIQDGITQSRTINSTTRATDKAPCFNLEASDSTLQICACSL